ncbi:MULTISPECIES: tetratricopeptide repeat protein [unclassified Shewanella]|uniref:tetratricopeptide repeat protein n=1 Tax=unclassified Shewanella TaxID=196818 RepID=UPI001BC1AB59|nr:MULTISPECIES: flagellar protein MotX [unclassified Shewanella]GIU19237.1 flagellar rotation associated protein MotX [Shewanella sp. MBTL60-112-B1]GIU25112.1 flagellar rotation associated protein MotX [Shewanella sp. MBTL60-112-B2]
MLRYVLITILSILSLPSFAMPKAVDVYTQEQLVDLIRTKRYLTQVKGDDCQIVQDIEARAEVLKQPLYQYLWAEMLNYGICVKANPPRGIAMLKTSAEQGSAEAMVRMAEYYHDGKFVIEDKQRAVQYTLPAAATGDLPARMMLVRLFGEGYGSPRDYEVGFHWLYNEVFSDETTQAEAINLLKVLEAKMPPSAVARAKKEHLRTPQ